MKILVKQTTEIERDIELPLFFLDEYNGYAFFEDSQLYFFHLNGHTNVSARPLDEKDIKNCLTNSSPATEDEFMSRYKSAVSIIGMPEQLLTY